MAACLVLHALCALAGVHAAQGNVAERRGTRGGWARNLSLSISPSRLAERVRRDTELRIRVYAAAGFAVGMCVVPRESSPDFNSFRTAEGWRQRLLSIKPLPVHQRVLMSVPIALALAFAADPPGNLEYLRAGAARIRARVEMRIRARVGSRMARIQLPQLPQLPQLRPLERNLNLSPDPDPKCR